MLRQILVACCAMSLGAAPALAQTDPPPPASEERPVNLEGEAIGYLAVPVLLVLVFLVGVLLGGGDEESESP